MGNVKANLMLLLAYRILLPSEWKMFKATFDTLRDRSTKLVRMTLKLPFANNKMVKRDYAHVLRDVL